jgi:hypothetical protein
MASVLLRSLRRFSQQARIHRRVVEVGIKTKVPCAQRVERVTACLLSGYQLVGRDRFVPQPRHARFPLYRGVQ